MHFCSFQLVWAHPTPLDRLKLKANILRKIFIKGVHSKEMASVTLTAIFLLAGFVLAMHSTGTSIAPYMVAIRNYGPVESGRKPRPFTIITENLDRDLNFGHLKGLETIVREGMDVVIFSKSFFSESGKSCLYIKPVSSTDLDATNIVPSIHSSMPIPIFHLQMNPSEPIQFSRFHRAEGKKNCFRKVDYVISDPSEKTAIVFRTVYYMYHIALFWLEIQNKFPSSHDFHFEMLVEYMPQSVSLVPFDAGSLAILQRAYMVSNGPITRDTLFSFVRKSTYSANPSAMLMIFYLTAGELEPAFFRLV